MHTIIVFFASIRIILILAKNTIASYREALYPAKQEKNPKVVINRYKCIKNTTKKLCTSNGQDFGTWIRCGAGQCV